MHNWNQLQPAPYDGMYSFPSVTAWIRRPASLSRHQLHHLPGTNCTICVANHQPAPTSIRLRSTRGTPMLPAGKYVVEVVVPAGL